MSKATRKKLDTLFDNLNKIQAMADDVRSELETLKDNEQDRFDAMSEKQQESDNGVVLQAMIEALENAESCISNVDNEITDAMNYIEEAKGEE